MSASAKTPRRRRTARRREARRRLRRSMIRRHGERLTVAGLWHYVLELDIVWVVFMVLAGALIMAPAGVFFEPDLSEGDIANRDYLATRDVLILDEATSEELKERARSDVRPLYDFNYAQDEEFEGRIRRLFEIERGFDEVADLLPEEDIAAERLLRLREGSNLRVDESHADLLAVQVDASDEGAELEERIVRLVGILLREGIVENKETLLQNRLEGVTLRSLQTGEESEQFDLFGYRGYPDEVESYLEAEVGGWGGWSRGDRERIVDFLMVNLTPNIYLNLSETQERRDAQAEAVGQVFNQIRAGQVIVRKGDEVDLEAINLLREMTGSEGALTQLRSPLASALLLGLAVAFLWVAFRRKRLVTVEARAFGSVVLLLILGLLATRFGFVVADALAASFEIEALSSAKSYGFAIPFAALALLVSVLFGRGAGLLVGFVFSVLVGRLGWAEAATSQLGLAGGTMLYALTGSLAAVFALDQLKQRSAVIRAGLLVGLVNMASVTVLTLLDGSGATLTGWGFELLCGLLGGLLVAAAVGFAIPVFEAVLFLTTDMKLMELSDTNLPLLQRLAFEAPGTFQHSLMVANLAKAGCEAVGGNPTLAYVGGLYHDIGKVLRPQYFVENQRDDDNPHDKLAPSMSALILVDHVKEGARMAREHGLPQPIVDAIEQHHGTRTLAYFLARARKRVETGEKINEHQYRYTGPMPQNKTMGVLMVADTVEAASRTLEDYSEESIRALVTRLLDDIVEDGQLDQTDLTLSDLRRMSHTLQNVLKTVHHHRVDYPGFEWGGESRGSLRVLPGGAGGGQGAE
ncbi:MAG: HDIG domain-containing protein [Acidobacteria bacterium]|nr:HDIG domain-containing protein [Acidobacteriota bacterium]